MAKTVNRLTELGVRKAKAPGVYHDGRGLYLHVEPNGGKSWLSRYELFGSRHWMGQGNGRQFRSPRLVKRTWRPAVSKARALTR
jgi:hypothetical protein